MPAESPFGSTLEAARAGADWAWERLLAQYDAKLRGYLRRQGATDVEDLVSETWLQVARGLPRFSGDEDGFRSWLFMIAHHRMVDERRRFSRKPADPVEQERLAHDCPPVPSAESEAVERLTERELQAVLDQLSSAQREVVLLRFFVGLGVTEIGDVVGKKPSAVRALQRRALRRLEKILGGGGALSAPRDGNEGEKEGTE